MLHQVGHVDNVRGACVGPENMWEISVPSPQCCYEPKASLKINVYGAKWVLHLSRVSLHELYKYLTSRAAVLNHFNAVTL